MRLLCLQMLSGRAQTSFVLCCVDFSLCMRSKQQVRITAVQECMIHILLIGGVPSGAICLLFVKGTCESVL